MTESEDTIDRSLPENIRTDDSVSTDTVDLMALVIQLQSEVLSLQSKVIMLTNTLESVHKHVVALDNAAGTRLKGVEDYVGITQEKEQLQQENNGFNNQRRSPLQGFQPKYR